MVLFPGPEDHEIRVPVYLIDISSDNFRTRCILWARFIRSIRNDFGR